MLTFTRRLIAFWFVLISFSLMSARANANNWESATCNNANGTSGACTPCAPTLTASNGFPQHPEIAALFWESSAGEWTNGTGVTNTRSHEFGMLLSLVNNAQYWSKIAPGQIATPRLAPYANIFTGNVDISNPSSPCFGTSCSGGHNPGAKANFTKADLEALINHEIQQGALPLPQANDHSIYLVFVPSDGTNAGCGDCNFTSCNHTGHNTLPPGCDPLNGANYNGTNYTVAFGQGDDAGMAHELVESIATYEGINNTNASCGGGGVNNQLVDVCDGAVESVNSFQVAAYYSATDHECVVPESWGEVYESPNLTGWVETTGAFAVRQAYGGAQGVVATNAVENGTSGNSVFFYNGSSWNYFGNGGTQFAAGGQIIAAIAMDPKYGIFYINAGGGSWNQAGGPNGQLVTGVTVTSSGYIVATDPSANPWYFDPWNPGWNQIAGPGDQFVATGSGVWALNPSHNDLFFWSGPGSGFNFTTELPATTQLLSSPDSSEFAFALPGQALFEGFDDVLWPGMQGGVSMGNSSQGPFFEYLMAGNDNVVVCEDGTVECILTNGVSGLPISGAVPFVTGCDSGSPPCVTLTSGAPLVQGPYQGCFADSATRDLPYLAYSGNGGATDESCVGACQNAGYEYAGAQYGSQCFCGNSFGAQGKSTNCTEACPGNSNEKCGGGYANSVYATGVEYQGCYADESTRDLPYEVYSNDGALTDEACVSACKVDGYKYAGAQWSRECFCGNSFGVYGTSANCTMACAGKSGETCGGNWANSVYATGN